MYLYFDKYGVLKEIINDDVVRLGDRNNRVYIYLEDRNFTSLWATLQKPDGTLTPEISITSNVVREEIPYRKDRDLKYFEDYREYDFNYYDIENVTSSGLALLTIRGVNGETIDADGLVTMNVEKNVIKVDHEITQSEYDYLIHFVGGFEGRIHTNETDIAALKEKDIDLQRQITANKDSIDTAIPNLQNQITANKNTLNLHNNRLVAVEDLAEMNAEEIGTLTADVATNQTNITNLTTRVTTNETNITAAGRDIANIQTSVNKNATDITKKLDKDLHLLALKESIADTDVFVIQRDNELTPRRITGAKLKEIFAQTEIIDHFKGDYLTLKKLQEAYPTANAGDYAYVSDSADILKMYVWDSDANKWKKTDTTQYVSQTIFDDFETLTNNALEHKVDKVENEEYVVYGTGRQDTTGGVEQKTIQYNQEPYGNGIVQRMQDGRVKGTTATEDNDLTNLAQVRNEVSAKNLALKFEGSADIVVDENVTGDKVEVHLDQAFKNKVDNKVDKVSGKGLSSNDFTTAEKNKLASLSKGITYREVA